MQVWIAQQEIRNNDTAHYCRSGITHTMRLFSVYIFRLEDHATIHEEYREYIQSSKFYRKMWILETNVNSRQIWNCRQMHVSTTTLMLMKVKNCKKSYNSSLNFVWQYYIAISYLLYNIKFSDKYLEIC